MFEKKFVFRKLFWPEKEFEKLLDPKTNFGQKQFWAGSEKNVGLKKFGHKIFWSPKKTVTVEILLIWTNIAMTFLTLTNVARAYVAYVTITVGIL